MFVQLCPLKVCIRMYLYQQLGFGVSNANCGAVPANSCPSPRAWAAHQAMCPEPSMYQSFTSGKYTAFQVLFPVYQIPLLAYSLSHQKS